jgi:hypothetical protein
MLTTTPPQNEVLRLMPSTTYTFMCFFQPPSWHSLLQCHTPAYMRSSTDAALPHLCLQEAGALLPQCCSSWGVLPLPLVLLH